MRTPAIVLFAALSLHGCTDEGSRGSSDLAIQIDTVGDTVRVHTASGSVWSDSATLIARVSIGELEGDGPDVFGRVGGLAVGPNGNVHVLDAQANEIRVFSPVGAHLRTMGGRGQGPGELQNPGGIGVLSDGRVLVRDPRNLRVQVYAADGTPEAEWDVIDPTYYTSQPVWVDGLDRSYIIAKKEPDEPRGPRPTILLRVNPEGELVDSIPDPGAHVEERVATLRGGANGLVQMTIGLQFFPNRTWSILPDGGIVRGSADGSAVEVVAPSGEVRRMSRSWVTVPVGEGEMEQAEFFLRSSMDRNTRDGEWDIPSFPKVKPAVSRVDSDPTGRIWVRLSGPAEQIVNPSHDPENENSLANLWMERPGLDLFGVDGTYLGPVRVPEEFSPFSAAYTATGVWAVTRDDLGVERVVFFELVLDGEEKVGG